MTREERLYWINLLKDEKDRERQSSSASQSPHVPGSVPKVQ